MSIKLNLKKANDVLLLANARRELLNDRIGRTVNSIIQGSHKTYRYVLITALLGKATDKDADILSLQAKDDSDGAYDARELCHKVIVPFEREYYPMGLGGSNEPYLNKPARYPRLSLSNAVRNGKDRQTLSTMIDILSAITTKDDAFKYLSSAIAAMEIVSKEYNSQYDVDSISFNREGKAQHILDYIYHLTDDAREGETCPIIVAALEQIYLGKEYQVRAHKVNESGASSKEIGDIDIWEGEDIIYSIEVKDKDFTKDDVGHAIRKFIEGGLEKSMFIYGKNAKWDRDSVLQLVARIGRTGHYCCVMSVLDFAKLRLMNIVEDINLEQFSSIIMDKARQINATDETIDWLKDSLWEIEV